MTRVPRKPYFLPRFSDRTMEDIKSMIKLHFFFGVHNAIARGRYVGKYIFNVNCDVKKQQKARTICVIEHI